MSYLTLFSRRRRLWFDILDIVRSTNCFDWMNEWGNLLINRQSDKTVKIQVYRKPTHTDQYLHFQSHHPIHHKSGVVRTLMDRKDTLVSTEDDKDREELHIRNALKSCGYDEWGNTWDTLGDGTGDRRTNKRTDRQTNRWTSPLRNASLRRGLNQTVLHSH